MLGHYNEAIACFNESLKINPKYEKTWYKKGVALNNLEKYDKAIECFDEAIKINPLNYRVWNYKGAALVELGHIYKGMKCYNKASKINKKLKYVLLACRLSFQDLIKFTLIIYLKLNSGIKISRFKLINKNILKYIINNLTFIFVNVIYYVNKN
jgi:tetratricopeptide (TPR) repeat protein